MNNATVTPRCARVLLVEDSHVQALLVQHAIDECDDLELLHIARDGEEALAFLRALDSQDPSQRPDLILLDLEMPKKDGFAALREIKQDPKLKTIPVVMLTSRDGEEDIARCYAEGASAYLTKPITFDHLAIVLEDLGRFWAHARLPIA